METAAGARYTTGKYAGVAMTGCPVLIRYADLSRCPHKSAYAEFRVMPSSGLSACVCRGMEVEGSA
jgi:hypothetical protein